MATTEKQLQNILQFFRTENISWRKMMGEYLFYADGVLFGGVYDGRLLIKDTPAGREVCPAAPLQLPYAGAKLMLYIDEEHMSDSALLKKLIDVTCQTLLKKKR